MSRTGEAWPGAAAVPSGSGSRRIGAAGGALVVFFAVASVVYFDYRIPLWNPASPLLSSLLLGAELFGTLTLALHVVMTWRLVERRAPPPPSGVIADIFVTTWNEPVELLRATLLAARRVRHAGIVWLLDDGCRPEMRALADELGVAYVGRVERDHAKAGNLNNALKLSTAAFVAVFDSDHAPASGFLERTLGYFDDARVAFVQTPQDFYNLDSIQHRLRRRSREVWHEQSLFYRVIQPGKDFWNATFFCGSCAVVRRAALDDIGGFATGTITEDFHTSVKLHARGWRSAFHAEPLAFGLSPFDIDQYATQRLRWGRGAMQVWRQERGLLRGRLTPAQWGCYFASTITYFEGWQKAVMYFLPAVVLVTGALPLIWTGAEFLLYFLPWFASGLIVTELFGRGYAKTLWMEEYNLLRYFTFIRATLALVIPADWRFQVTSKQRTPRSEQTAKLMPQMLIAGVTGIALLAGALIQFTTAHLPVGAFWVNVLWAVFNAALALKALSFARRRSRQRRGAYRFPLPLPVRLAGADGITRTVIAEDVSSHGMSLRSGDASKVGDVVRGDIMLPQGPTPFSGRVVHRVADAGGGPASLGLNFAWGDRRDSDALSTLLYGNALQWDVNSWSDGGRSRFRRLYARRDRRDAPAWTIGTLAGRGEAPVRCLARPEHPNAASWRVVAYGRPAAVDGLRLALSGRGRHAAGLAVNGCEAVSIGDSRVFVMSIGRSGAAAAFHRDPAWGGAAPGRA